MLLRHDAADAVEVISLFGPVEAADLPALLGAVCAAVASSPRGVVLDLCEAGPLVDGLVALVHEAAALAPGWPRPRLSVCCAEGPVADRIAEVAPLYAERDDALAHVDDRGPGARERISLSYGTSAPGEARAALGAWCAGLGLGDVLDDLLLVTSELVTNAVLHAAPPVELEVHVEERGGGVTVSVLDGEPEHPLPRDADGNAEGGRGMLLVDLLSGCSGVRPQPPGKAVWAALERPRVATTA